ncbi:unnamed protein product [Cylicocyclus nassatus]|uniref:Uncharacterized protein n=1 Tax=Cylicocyclus nassatus TaxID=53992 RepID=A0AA36DMT1_CYLNA|nr:unnamed protein product [Cylicocyclus nassatus]
MPVLSLAYHENLNPVESSFRHDFRHHHNSLTGAVKKSFAEYVQSHHVLVANRIYMLIAKLLIWLRLESGLHQKKDCLFFIDNGPKRNITARQLARRLSKHYGVAVHEVRISIIVDL